MVKNEKGFTLIEMVLVIFALSVLLLVMLPNITKQKEVISGTGCDVYKKTVETQLHAYVLETKTSAATVQMSDLIDGGYLSSETCPDGRSIAIVDGEIVVGENETASTE